tara:strand:+ start:265 stop:678 length:414 start_codon:yes stop_codon:yes gene_type:complete
MQTDYKVVKLTNGDNIICEAIEHVNETYIISTPLKMEVVQDNTSRGPVECLHLSAWISPFTESKYFEIKENHVIVITEASVGLSAYYQNIINKHKKFADKINDELDNWEKGPTDEEMFDEDFEEFVKINKIDKTKYH